VVRTGAGVMANGGAVLVTALMSATGMRAKAGSRDERSQKAQPAATGIMRSLKIRLGGGSAHSSRRQASAPFVAA
jgi:hypothetical protein